MKYEIARGKIEQAFAKLIVIGFTGYTVLIVAYAAQGMMVA